MSPKFTRPTSPDETFTLDVSVSPEGSRQMQIMMAERIAEHLARVHEICEKWVDGCTLPDGRRIAPAPTTECEECEGRFLQPTYTRETLLTYMRVAHDQGFHDRVAMETKTE